METKIDAPQRKVFGYFAAFGNKDHDGDIIVPGAFTKTIAERGPLSARPSIMFLRDHDSTRVPGRLDALVEDDKGLFFEATLAKTPLGDETLELYGMKALNQHSIGFQTVRDHYDAGSQTRYLEEIKLWEGSVVPWGSNEMTPLVGMKAVGFHSGWMRQIEDLIKQAPDEEYRQKIMLFAQQLKAEHEAALRNDGQPSDKDTSRKAEPQDNATLREAIEELKKLKQIFRRA